MSEVALAARRAVSSAIRPRHLVAAVTFVAAATLVGLFVGSVYISPGSILSDVWWRLGAGGHLGGHHLGQTQAFIVWQLRAPRVVLGLLVGGALAVAGATYQGVFRNPLADPFLLGIAAGAGLGATIAIVVIGGGVANPSVTPVFAFAGALLAVGATWLVAGRASSGPATLILAGVAVAAFLGAGQTMLQQSSNPAITTVYRWLLGSLASATWSSDRSILPYVAVSAVVCLGCARLLDVLSVGELESASLGLPVGVVRAVAIGAASLGAAAAVAAAGLIGFVGIIVPHAVRLLTGVSYRRILPLSLLGGGGFLVLADVVARTALPDQEVPIGVVTAAIGVPFFVLALHVRRLRLR